jgi:hypothetical protein
MQHTAEVREHTDFATESSDEARIGDVALSNDAAMGVLYIEELTDSEKVALMKIARSYAQVSAYSGEDLIHEAFTRVLSGQVIRAGSLRTIHFLAQVVQSISWEWRERPDRAVADAHEHHEASCASLPTSHRPTNPPEWLLTDFTNVMASKIVALFDGDSVATRLVIAMMDGAKGEELKSVGGLNEAEHQSKLRILRRRVGKFYAERVRRSH